MSYLLFPGRHLVNTRFQEDYLQRLLSTRPSALPALISGRCEVSEPPREIIFAITSANQENSRFNPIPFHVRAMGVDRFAGNSGSGYHLASTFSAFPTMGIRRTLQSLR